MADGRLDLRVVPSLHDQIRGTGIREKDKNTTGTVAVRYCRCESVHESSEHYFGGVRRARVMRRQGHRWASYPQRRYSTQKKERESRLTRNAAAEWKTVAFRQEARLKELE